MMQVFVGAVCIGAIVIVLLSMLWVVEQLARATGIA